MRRGQKKPADLHYIFEPDRDTRSLFKLAQPDYVGETPKLAVQRAFHAVVRKLPFSLVPFHKGPEFPAHVIFLTNPGEAKPCLQSVGVVHQRVGVIGKKGSF